MSQTQQILSLLKRGRKLSPAYAWQAFGCMRLAARIAELRQSGVDIRTEMVERAGKRWAQYRLARD